MGTRTIVDVLDATTTLYDRKRNLSQVRYDYLINQLNLKSALGTLNETDLVALNNTLGKTVPTDPQTVAPENATQEARADGPDTPRNANAARRGAAQAAPQPRSASLTTAPAADAGRTTGRNPFQH